MSPLSLWLVLGLVAAAHVDPAATQQAAVLLLLLMILRSKL
jgi:hypothetical protein